MAQRKPPSGGKPAAKKGTSRPAGKPGAGSPAKPAGSSAKAAGSSAKATGSAAKAAAASAAARKKPAARKPGKSIVNQKQTPWGTIIAAGAVVAFAVAVVLVVVLTGDSGDDNNAPGCGNPANARYCLPELAAAKQIAGVTYKKEPNHTHVEGTVKYNATPPVGGNHSGYWADCNGTVYPQPIANENAVHPLEHGAVWLTYREGLPADEVATLAKDVTGQKYVFMSPYPDLKSKVSLQAWGYQLFVNSVTDPRITQFIAALAANTETTPEVGASCDQPTFKANPSTFGHPLAAPAAGGSVTMSSSAAP